MYTSTTSPRPTAIVTGAARGIGLATTERLVRDGWDVIAVDRDAGSLDSMPANAAVTPVVADVTDEGDVARVVQAAANRRVEALVNNAGAWDFTSIADTTPAAFRSVLEVNVMGTFLCTRAFIPKLAEHGGAIVNLSSVAARATGTGVGGYPAAKAAVEAFTRQTALELGEYEIRANVVGPGIIPTEGTIDHFGRTQEEQERRAAGFPLRRLGTPDEVADVIAFLISDAARYVTAQVIYVDGGMTEATSVFQRMARHAVADPPVVAP